MASDDGSQSPARHVFYLGSTAFSGNTAKLAANAPPIVFDMDHDGHIDYSNITMRQHTGQRRERAGHTTATLANGSTMQVADVSFEYTLIGQSILNTNHVVI